MFVFLPLLCGLSPLFSPPWSQLTFILKVSLPHFSFFFLPSFYNRISGTVSTCSNWIRADPFLWSYYFISHYICSNKILIKYWKKTNLCKKVVADHWEKLSRFIFRFVRYNEYKHNAHKNRCKRKTEKNKREKKAGYVRVSETMTEVFLNVKFMKYSQFGYVP